MELSRTRTSSHDVEYTRRPLSSDAVARPARESSEVGVNGGSVLENANEPVVPSFRVWHWQHVTKRPVVRPREPDAVPGNRVDLATQRHRFVTAGCDLAPLVARPASRGIWNPKKIIIIIIRTIIIERETNSRRHLHFMRTKIGGLRPPPTELIASHEYSPAWARVSTLNVNVFEAINVPSATSCSNRLSCNVRIPLVGVSCYRRRQKLDLSPPLLLTL